MTEWDEEAMARLRAAVHAGRGDTSVLRGRPLRPVLQYAGDLFVAALSQPPIDVGFDVGLARACLDELRGRDLPGDAELAEHLAEELGELYTEPLASLPADLGAVAAALEDGDQVLDLERGDVLPADELPDDECGGRRWRPIPPAVLPVGEDARRGAARKWLAGEGYRPVPRRL
ncbi:hypothetical protein [Actinomadura bangladeshensis]|uniref:Uncharacterized protein n=1 Tax=Actinomadura bangladeshensis TaxID=453573 RepID=A0A4V2XLT1_9ACTN|nr:hypothetical protein [Actinomadura bangladeshensis]TDC11596.1 hypothetical protein E1284_27725 [Actinomadura bangladeshensis]